MTREEAERALKTRDELISRALQIVDKAPYFQYAYEPDWARLTFEGEECVLRMCRAEVSYECPSLETDEIRFPAYLLFVSTPELHSWQAEEYRLYEQRERAKRDAAAKAREANERATYELLKLKFD